MTNTTNQVILGTTHTTTISATAPSASRVYTIPDAGGSANVVLDAGNYTIAGTWSFSNSITLASSKAVILTDNTTHTVTIKATNATTTYTLQLPTTAGTNTYFLQTDGSGNTSWQPGGSGTVQSGTAGNLTLYPATAASVVDTYVQNTKNITIGIAAQAARSANLAYVIPNPGNAVTSDTFALLGLAQTFSGINTFSAGAGAITLSSSTILGADGTASLPAYSFSADTDCGLYRVAANDIGFATNGVERLEIDTTNVYSYLPLNMGPSSNHKIINLANGTASTDAAAFGQIPTIYAGFQAPVQATTTSSTATTNNTYTVTALTANITPTSSSHRIKITVTGSLRTANGAAADAFATLARGGTNILTATGFVEVSATAGIAINPTSCCYIDSPASTSALTYAVYIKNDDNATSVSWNAGGQTSTIILEEIA